MNTTYPNTVERENELMRQREEARRQLGDLRDYARAVVDASMSNNQSSLDAAINNLNDAIKRTTY